MERVEKNEAKPLLTRLLTVSDYLSNVGIKVGKGRISGKEKAPCGAELDFFIRGGVLNSLRHHQSFSELFF